MDSRRRPDRLYEAVWLGRDRFRFRDFMTSEFPRGANGAPGHACVGPITYRGHDRVRRNIGDLKAALAAAGIEDGFLTAVAPASTGYDASNEYYSDERDYVFAIAEALREEYLEIVNAGLVLQVDDAVLAEYVRRARAAEPGDGTGSGRSCAWMRSITRCVAFRKIACDTTCALAAGTSRTWPTHRSRPSSR